MGSHFNVDPPHCDAAYTLSPMAAARRAGLQRPMESSVLRTGAVTRCAETPSLSTLAICGSSTVAGTHMCTHASIAPTTASSNGSRTACLNASASTTSNPAGLRLARPWLTALFGTIAASVLGALKVALLRTGQWCTSALRIAKMTAWQAAVASGVA
eukprot:2709136-Prymnesium_polylepis.1